MQEKKDQLPEYILSWVRIADPDVIQKSGEDQHPIISHTGNPQDLIPGMVFEVSTEELQ